MWLGDAEELESGVGVCLGYRCVVQGELNRVCSQLVALNIEAYILQSVSGA